MSRHHETRQTQLVAEATGRRWCSHCEQHQPLEGFVKRGPRWICGGCIGRIRKAMQGRKAK